MRQMMKKASSATWLTGWAILLSGCGGGEDSASTKPPVPTKPVVAFDGLMTAKVDTPTVMDLAPYIQGSAPRLTSVASLNPENCYANASGDLRVEVTLTRPGRCDYTYTVADTAGTSSSAELTVVSSDAERPVLPSGSIATTPSANVVVSLSDLLGSGVIPSGYALSEMNVQHEQGSEPVSALTQTGPLTFSFTAPEVFGWNYISYVMTNATTGNAMIGSVFVSTSDELNEPPVISPELFTYPKSVSMNELVTIDLSSVSGLSITDDSGQWQLQNVKALGATVTPVAPNDSTNKAFTFRASAVGTYDVAYIVSDYVGGATMGIIRIAVDSVPVTPTKPWKNISTGGLVYTAPLIHSEAKVYGNAQYVIETIKDKNYQVARWGNTAAAQYCDTIGGRLPTLAELQALYNATGSAATERSNWPVNTAYLSHDAQYGLVSLKDGSWSQYVAGFEAYVTCIDRGLAHLEIEPLYTNDGENTTEDSLIAGKTMDIKATLTTRKGNLPIQGIRITAEPARGLTSSNLSDYYGTREGISLAGTNEKRLEKVTPEFCMQACEDETTFECRSFDYNTSEQWCDLSDGALTGTTSVDVELVHYNRLSDSNLLYRRMMDQSPVTTSYKNMAAISEAQCQQACTDDTKCAAYRYDTEHANTPSETCRLSESVNLRSMLTMDGIVTGIKATPTISCPTVTDADGIATCTYSNTVAGNQATLFTAEQSLGVDNAEGVATIAVSPDAASAQINAPKGALVKPGDVPTVVRVSQTDKYYNPIPGLRASIVDYNEAQTWTIDGQSTPNAMVSYPSSATRDLLISARTSDAFLNDTAVLRTQTLHPSGTEVLTQLHLGIKACTPGELSANPNTACQQIIRSKSGWALTQGVTTELIKVLAASEYNEYEWLDLRYWYLTQPNAEQPYGYPVDPANRAGLALYNKGGANLNTWEKYNTVRAQAVQYCDVLTKARFAGRRWYGYINSSDMFSIHDGNKHAGSFDASFFQAPYATNGGGVGNSLQVTADGGSENFCSGTSFDEGCYINGSTNSVRLFYSQVPKDQFNVSDPDTNPYPKDVSKDMGIYISDLAVRETWSPDGQTSENIDYLYPGWSCVSMPDDILPPLLR